VLHGVTIDTPPTPGTPVETETPDYYDRLIFVRAVHPDFPEQSRRCIEYISYPKDLSQAIDVEVLLTTVKENMGLSGAGEAQTKTALKEYAVSIGGSQLDESAAAVSYALRYGLAISHHKAVLKGLAQLDDFEKGTEPGSVKYVSAGQLLFPISLSEQNRLTTTIGLEGEWYVGRVRGVIYHRSIGATTLAAATTGLPIQSSSISAITWTTEFNAIVGAIPIDVMFKGDVSLTQVEYLLMKGELDRSIRGMRATSLVRGSIGEVWCLTHG